MGEVAALLGGASGVGGTVVEAMGAQYEGEAAKASASYNARLAMAQARARAEKIRADAKRVRGDNIVRTAKSGVRMEGSALKTLTENAFKTEKAALNELRAGRAAADLYHAEGQMAIEASRFRVASTVLKGLGNLGGAAGGLGGVGAGGAPTGGGG